MKLLRRINENYFGNRVLSGDVFTDYVTTDGQKPSVLVLKMPRKKHQVRKDAKKLKEFPPINGDGVYQRLKENPHPNVMGIYDYTTEYIWSEYIDGPMLYHTYVYEPKDLYRGYDNIKFWLPDRGYVEGMAEGIQAGLEHLHSIGIYHGDFKPNNVMVNSQGVVKIIDFHASLDLPPDVVDYNKDLLNLKKTLKGLDTFR